MAKKKHKKKHSFQHKTATKVVSSSSVQAQPADSESHEWQIVATDVRRSLLLAAFFIAAMLALWFVMNHTSLL